MIACSRDYDILAKPRMEASTFYRQNDAGLRVSNNLRKSRTCSRHRLRILSSLLFVSPEIRKPGTRLRNGGKTWSNRKNIGERSQPSGGLGRVTGGHYPFPPPPQMFFRFNARSCPVGPLHRNSFFKTNLSPLQTTPLLFLLFFFFCHVHAVCFSPFSPMRRLVPAKK